MNRLLETSTPIKYLKGVGEKRALLLAKLGIFTVGDLLYFFPRAYEDRSRLVSIADAVPGEVSCIKATVCLPVSEAKIRKGMSLYKTKVTDGESLMNLTFFNNKYVKSMLEEGEEYIFVGKVNLRGYTAEMTSPAFEKAESGERIRPIYPQTHGLNSKAIEKLALTALDATAITDPLPEKLRNDYCLMPVDRALRNMHAPENEDLLSEAKRRLIFEELLMLQTGLLRLRGKNSKTTSCVIPNDYTADFFGLLPFEPTNAQKRAVAESVEDMRGGAPMNRLLQGDVGSGKTAVAAALIYNAAKNGWQSALMAPTEVLAMQHYKTFLKFFENTDIKVELLTGSTPAAEKKAIKQRLASGESQLAVGTHALIQKDVAFKKLALVITDEQHRFGVNQRTALGEKGESPHVLVMSATPIPRTLALIIYSDLDLSVLDELPKGRQKIETFAIDGAKRERAYGYVKKHLLEGRQGYIVCPLVEENEDDPDSELVSAENLKKELSEGFFSGFTVGLLHGRMKADEKREVMNEFAAGSIQLLVSTTVIEVGIDVPNAVIMVIENAERFGLSQLHQLRGRIGRGQYKSTCILISDAGNEDAVRRLKTMVATTDGFKIADEDLRMRGPGDFFGSRQHGLPDLKIADMMTDVAVLAETRQAAVKMLENNPALEGDEYRNLREKINSMFSRAMN
ncbi:MAG: ATP-dependent DNA helicase RecG [Clostridia bacterium]|nr:ATP-dependent DNA helicase RecG [Clostridia bacterium]